MTDLEKIQAAREQRRWVADVSKQAGPSEEQFVRLCDIAQKALKDLTKAKAILRELQMQEHPHWLAERARRFLGRDDG